jgi:hypothetical protein
MIEFFDIRSAFEHYKRVLGGNGPVETRAKYNEDQPAGRRLYPASHREGLNSRAAWLHGGRKLAMRNPWIVMGHWTGGCSGFVSFGKPRRIRDHRRSQQAMSALYGKSLRQLTARGGRHEVDDDC